MDGPPIKLKQPKSLDFEDMSRFILRYINLLNITPSLIDVKPYGTYVLSLNPIPHCHVSPHISWVLT